MAKAKSQKMDGNARRRLVSVILIFAVLIIGGAAIILLNSGRGMKTPVEKTLTPTERMLLQASRLAEAGQLNRAVTLLKTHLRQHPDDIVIRAALAQLLLSMNRVKEVNEQLDSILTYKPHHAKALWLKAMLAKTAGEPFEDWMVKAADSPEPDPEVQGLYGVYLAGHERESEAELYLEKALAGGVRSAPVLGASAEMDFSRGRIRDAKAKLLEVVQKAPKEARGWSLLGETQKNLGEFKDAAESLENALSVARTDERGAVLILLGQIYATQNMWEKAGKAYADATMHGAVAAPAALKAAQCYFVIDEYARAMKYIDLAAELAPGQSEVAEWREKIENARFPRTQPTTTKEESFLDFKLNE